MKFCSNNQQWFIGFREKARTSSRLCLLLSCVPIPEKHWAVCSLFNILGAIGRAILWLVDIWVDELCDDKGLTSPPAEGWPFFLELRSGIARHGAQDCQSLPAYLHRLTECYCLSLACLSSPLIKQQPGAAELTVSTHSFSRGVSHWPIVWPPDPIHYLTLQSRAGWTQIDGNTMCPLWNKVHEGNCGACVNL